MKELARLEKAEPQATVTQIQAVSLDDSDDEESNPAADAADGEISDDPDADAADGEISDDPDADDEMADDASSSDKTMADDAASSSSDKILVEDGSEEIFDDAHEAINEMVDEASSDQDIADEASHSAEEDIADDASSSSEEILTLDDFHECLDACRSGIDELHDQIQDHGAQISDEAMAIVMDMLEERINDLEQIFHEHEDVEWEINHLVRYNPPTPTIHGSF